MSLNCRKIAQKMGKFSVSVSLQSETKFFKIVTLLDLIWMDEMDVSN